ncbi:hypothetical protein VNO78_33121 [Psophocarpus tetragonolobus]|uniref:Protein kinase domain-containing protein n=1 Tax=Psophocarpus tetragonolobus TaxID=3891 RepID=A0AAN9NWP8_PSOTE
MGRDEYIPTSFLSVLFFFCFCPMVLSLLFQNQTQTMNNISMQLSPPVPWNASEPCAWKGVICDNTNSSVVGISLSGSKLLSFEFLPLVCKIQTLEYLDVSNNRMSSVPDAFISECGKIKGLKLLNFSGNKLGDSLPNFLGFDALESLDMSLNMFGGSIGLELDGLVSLKILNLSSNVFRGPIPTSSFGSLTSLEVLDLSNNLFSGPIPDDLTRMSALTQLILSNNFLSGAIPKFTKNVHVDYSGMNYLKNTTAQDNPIAQSGSKKVMSVHLRILVAIMASSFLVGIVLQLVVSRKNHHQPKVILSNLLTTNAMHKSSIRFSKVMEVVSDASNVTLKTRFSTYYKAIMPSGSIYFIKKLNCSNKILSVGSHDKFGKELEVLANLKNSNIMTPLAYFLSIDTAYILYEYISNGSLYDVLHGSMLDWGSRYSIAVGVAKALSFLHGFSSSPILLLDLSSKSIMLKSLMEPLVGDIEHYRVINFSKSTGNFSEVVGSIGYTPPEYAYTMTVTMAGNVYSFGVILLELLTGEPPVTEGIELVKWVLDNSTKPQHILDFNLSRSSREIRSKMLAILKISLLCVSTDPQARPNMNSVLHMLLIAA